MLCEENYIQVACKYGHLIERQIWAGAIYSALNGTDGIILERLLWWKEKFSNAEITQEIVKNAFKNINKITKIAKYHAFQYKLLFNSIYLGSRLVHMGLADTNLCVLCNKEKEEIVHFFCNCEIANTIWQSLAKWIYEEWNVSINLHNLPPYKVLFNDAHDNIINFISVIVLITKYQLYSVQCQNERPSIAVIKSEITFI